MKSTLGYTALSRARECDVVLPKTDSVAFNSSDKGKFPEGEEGMQHCSLPLLSSLLKAAASQGSLISGRVLPALLLFQSIPAQH